MARRPDSMIPARPGDGPGRLPDAIVLGATKAGTTSLFRYLDDHPQVFMDPQKELRFFSDPRRFAEGVDWYRNRFAGAGDLVAMESSNAYTRDPVYPDVPERMVAVCPDVRLVYLVRDPWDRLESHYRHRLAMGREWRRPSDAVRCDPSYVSASRFGHQLSRFREHYPAEQVHVERSERLHADETARADLCDFLGLDHDASSPWPRENSTTGRAAVPAFARRLYGMTRSERLAGHARRVSDRLPLGRDAASAPFELDDGLRDELAELFDADRQLLSELAGDRIAEFSGLGTTTEERS